MLYRIQILVVCMLVIMAGRAQYVSFSHITVANGLTDNNIQSLAVDKNGFLWIGTSDGLNVYDGYTVTNFKRREYPAIASNNVIHLTCDSRNRIWLGTAEGITWIDQHRQFHRVVLNDSVTRFAARTIVDTKVYGPVLYTSLGQYYFDEKKDKWIRLEWIPEKLKYNYFIDAEPFDENRILYSADTNLILLDYSTRQIVFQKSTTPVFSLCRYSDHEIAAGHSNGSVEIVDVNTGQVVKTYQLTTTLNDKRIQTNITEVRRAVNGDLLVATGFAGLFIIDKTGKTTQYTHDPINPRSIGGDITWRVLGGNGGDMIVGTSIAGVSIFNVFKKTAGNIRIFKDDKGKLYDNYISEITADRNGILWMGALDKLIRWDKARNQTTFYNYFAPKPIENDAQNVEIRTVCVDRFDKVWIGALGDGLSVLDERKGTFEKIKLDTNIGVALNTKLILEIYSDRSGLLWVGTNRGMFTIDPLSREMNAFTAHPVLKTFAGKRVNGFLEDRKGNMWFSTMTGVYCYDKSRDSLLHFNGANGMSSNRCFALYEDRRRNIYVSTLNGFSIIDSSLQVQRYDQSNGLKYDYIGGILEDDRGDIWMSNGKEIVQFNPVTQSLQYFDENAGIPGDGFRMMAFAKSKEGEMFWGSRGGISFFYPNELVSHTSGLRVNIFQADQGDSIRYLSGNEKISLDYGENSIIFRFAAINLQGSRAVKYKYMLQGYEKQWQTGTDIREAHYSSLPPGKYSFAVKASMDGLNWIDSNNTVEITIIAPLWQQNWFIVLMTAALTVAIFLFIRNRNRKIHEQREELETEQAINYFATSLNEQQSVEMILWDVARNCIGRLHFEDCVIYLMDENRKVLIQKAAFGPKSPRQYEIQSPLELPLGTGIVGSVAASGRAEIIDDTSKDPRYIMDVENRLSEITVPIMSDHKVLGVIDCEHSKKAFFTQKHLWILTTIASLCANKIVRARAEEEKRRVEKNLMDTKQKMADVEMQALRAQMNPHFIFNCLNSINRYIVKSDQATASLYLTRFAKLIRLILDNSNSKNVILANELEALKLYIEMEALRFDKKFSYRIIVDDKVGAECVEVPPLIIQPYVENAIWHGLLHKESGGELNIHVSMIGEGMLQCVIEDNGVGRDKARELKSKSATSRKSLGMKLTEDRLTLLNKHAELNASIDIIDLKNDHNLSLGTKVILKIPV